MRDLRASALVVAAAALLAACGESGPPVPHPTSIALSDTSLTMTALGATQQLTATVRDQNGQTMSGQTLTWSTGDPGIAAVSTSGLVTAVANGQTQVAVVSDSLSASATVTVAQVADALAKVSGDNQVGLTGQPLPEPVVVRVTDALGHPFPGGQQVVFAAATGGGSVSDDTVITDANGIATVVWTLGPTVGTQTLTATAVGLTSGSPATFSATASNTQIPTGLVKVAGDNLIGLVGKVTNEPPTVRVEDQIGAGIQGVTVSFVTTSGSGSVSAATAVTDVNGLASVDWTLGGSAGSNGLQASSGSLTPVMFTATGATAAFNIVVRYFGAQQPTATQQAAFAAAQARWETLIFGDLPDIPVTAAAGTACGSSFPDLPAIDETIDDIVIYAKVDSIDGVGNVLGQASPCMVRSSSGLPVVGVMQFDSADLSALESSGQLDLVILHEMGHVLGYGVLWNLPGVFDLLANACPSATGCTTDPHFTGAHAITAFDRVGGSSYVAGAKVPVEDCVSTPASCDAGTVNSHWRESVLDRELMTGYLNPGPNPLSIVTLGSFWDMTYLVNYADADAYAWPTPPALRGVTGGAVLRLKDDVLRVPLRLVDRSGRVVRVIQPPGARP